MITSLLYRILRFSRITFAVLSSILVIAGHSFLQAQVVKDSSLATILARAYSMVKVNSPEAEPLFEKAVSMDPSNVSLRKQLGYTYNSNKKYELALLQFVIADSLRSSDTTELQIAYNLILLNRQKEAEPILNKLRSSSSSRISESAINQLSVLSSSTPLSLWWTRIYLAPYYDTRWQTTFFQANIQEGYYITEDKLLSAFGFCTISGDARSSGGLSPVIFSDNSLVVGLGINIKPFYGFQFNVQQGLAFDLIKRSSRSEVMGDFRAVAIYGNGIYPVLTLHDNLTVPLSLLADVYSSAGYYSRYKNGIVYLQGRLGVRLFEVSSTVFDVFVKGGFVRDTEKEYYNNLLEGGLGFRFIPQVKWGLYFIGEFHRGYYWDVGTTRNPHDQYYNSIRFFIIFDQSF